MHLLTPRRDILCFDNLGKIWTSWTLEILNQILLRCGRAMILDANTVLSYGVRRGVRVRFQTPRTRNNVVENDIIPESCVVILVQMREKLKHVLLSFEKYAKIMDYSKYA